MTTVPGIGIDMPDVVEAGRPFTILLMNAVDLRSIDVQIRDTDTGTLGAVVHPRLRSSGDADLTADVNLDHPGLYRLSVKGFDGTSLTRLFLVIDDGIDPMQ